MAHRILQAAAVVLIASSSASGMDLGMEGAKSKQKALRLSLAATLVPAVAGAALVASSESDGAMAAGLALIGMGVALGPSAGRVYADGSFSVSRTAGRLLGAGLAVLGVAAATHSNEDMLASRTPDWKASGSWAVAGLGVTIISLSTIQDIVAANRAVEQFNRAKPKMSWSVGAKYFAKDKALGAAVTFKF